MEGNGYVITWAFGHLVSLAPPEMYDKTTLPLIPSVFKLVSRREKTPHGYEPDREAIKQLKIIKSVFSRCSSIIVATDAGREGELIFRLIYRFLDCSKPFSRLWISSLTDRAIADGFRNLKPGSMYDNLYLAAEARSHIDWVIGINASRTLQALTGDDNNSLGRVQTPTLAMVCARYEENRSFCPRPYWIFKAGIEKDGIMVRFSGLEKASDKATAEKLFSGLEKNKTLRITKTEQKECYELAPFLHDLGSLQQEANKRHGFSAEYTLNIAQKLYEKEKLISYPRTGSCFIPHDVFTEIPALIKSLKNHPLFGTFTAGMDSDRLSERSVDDDKITDHHALIITGRQPGKLSPDEQTLYDMIAGRMLEAFSQSCVRDILTVQAVSGSGMALETKGIQTRDAGWKAVFNQTEESAEDEDTPRLPEFTQGEELTVTSCNLLMKNTVPRPLYTEASLLADMEHAAKMVDDEDLRSEISHTGIGTPATRAGIIETLVRRGYIEREKKNLIPAEKGMGLFRAVRDMQIADVSLTAEWEQQLSMIEKDAGKLNSFREKLGEYTHRIVDELSSMELPPDPRMLKCPKCSFGAVIIRGKVAKCNNSSCNMTIYKAFCGKTMTDKHVLELLVKGKTSLIKGFKSRADKSFDAYLKFDDKHNIVFEFPKNDRRK